MNEKILVVDDELDILEMLSSFLTHEGFQVKTAPNGNAAIEVFKSEPFDLVISDMRMPGMDGLTVMRRLKEMDENIEVIILTAFAGVDNVIEAFRNKGAFDYLTKPLENINELFITVTQALDSRQLKIENKALQDKIAALPPADATSVLSGNMKWFLIGSGVLLFGFLIGRSIKGKRTRY